MGGKRKSCDDAATAFRITDRYSGMTGWMFPMQPRRLPRLLMVTKVAPFAWRRGSFIAGSGAFLCFTYSTTVLRASCRSAFFC